MKEVSLCMIVKDETDILDRCLKSMKGAFDELIIVLDHKQKNSETHKIAQKHGARVEFFEWCDDFAKARNYAFSFATKDLTMWVDADDVLLKGDAKRFKDLINSLDWEKYEGINFPYIYSHETPEARPKFKYHRLRVWKRGIAEWFGRIHEYPNVNEYDENRFYKCDDIDFHHFREGSGSTNTKRNLKILRKIVNDCNDTERKRYLFYYGKELMYNKSYREAVEVFLDYLQIATWLPEKHRAMYELACAYIKLEREEEAKEWCFKAINFNPDYPDPYILLGQIEYDKENWASAAIYFERATALDAPEVLFFDYIPYNTYLPYDYLSICYWKMNKFERGLECVKKCIEYKPEDERYEHNLKQFEGRLNDNN